MASTKLTILARNFSTTSQRVQLAKPPIQVFGLEGRYATALYSAASKQKKLEVVEKDLDGFTALLKKDIKFSNFIFDPTLKRQLKMEAMNSAVTKQKTHALTSNLLLTMAENGRYKKIEGVAKAYKKIMSAYRGEVLAEVITAKPLDDALMKELQAALNAFLKKGETLQLTAHVDPDIIGGMIVSVGDKYIDMSMASKINKYAAALQAVV